ncbi:amine sulfotransferase-like [Pseudophryne corroboree]|uniref:amine sulfotransferase-like n=1 Tax=Pseudophryne corroboree TaxID=495146 RepID=UPI003081652E
MDQTLVDELCNSFSFKHKGVYFVADLSTPEVVDSIEHMEIRDSDVFLVTYPKSGTIWTQNILCLIFKESQWNVSEDVDNMAKAPWLEYNLYNIDYDSRPSPRLFTTHMPYYLMPKDLRKRRSKVIYVLRNPKDVAVSYYHFYKMYVKLQHLPITWEVFFELYMSGKGAGGSWFDHVRDWYTHKEEFNCLFLSYEDMIKDLRSEVLKICQFLDVKLDDQAVNRIVENAKFKNMKEDPLANYTFLPEAFLNQRKGGMLRKGIIGDWKHMMTVAQSEKIDAVLKEKLGDLPITFIWDINEETES